ncbi:hypothetical protein Hanom_Chr03g00205521 [Helianthus anomalus]
MPLGNEHHVESITVRAMAWFSAVVSSGTPIVFVNIHTEQILSTDKCNSNKTPRQGIRLWFLPGLAEIPIELILEPRENRFGIDVKRTEEVISIFILVSRVFFVISYMGRYIFVISPGTGIFVILREP